jgi:hypothetical protein
MPGNQWANSVKESNNTLESWRYECEIRQLLVYRTQFGLIGFRAYFARPTFDSRRERIAKDVYDQYKKGNRGAWGDWR